MTCLIIHKTSRACICAPGRFILILQNNYTKEVKIWYLDSAITDNPLRYNIVLDEDILPGDYNYYLCSGGNITYLNVDPNDAGDIYICNLEAVSNVQFANGVIAKRTKVGFSHKGKPLTINGDVIVGDMKPNCLEADEICIVERGIFRVCDDKCIPCGSTDIMDYYATTT